MPDFIIDSIWVIIPIIISLGALWISLRAEYRTKKIEKPEISLMFGTDGTVIVTVTDYTKAQNLKINEVKAKFLKKYLIVRLFTRYKDINFSIRGHVGTYPRVFELDLSEKFSPLEGHRFKLCSNYENYLKDSSSAW